MKTRNSLTLLAIVGIPCLTWAQNGQPPQPNQAAQGAPGASLDSMAKTIPDAPPPSPSDLVMPSPTPAAGAAMPDAAAPAVPTVQAAAGGAPMPDAGAAPAPLVTSGANTRPAPMGTGRPGEIMLNFQGAQITDVLKYLSNAAGFIILPKVPVNGTVTVISQRPVTAEDAVDLLNTVLIDQNIVAVRNGRILKIESREDAQKDGGMPVVQGSVPAAIPQNDTMVTQIMPVRFADVSKLIDNLRPLLSDEASLSANDASNAIILTDTQANIKRMAKIIEALDTSISGISTVHVFHLQYGDAKSLADLLTTLFAPAPTTGGGAAAGGSRGGGGFPGFGGFGGFGGGGGGGGRGGGGGGSAATQSQARTAATRVVAVADETSNSVIVSAPDEMMSTISEMVSELDQSITAVSETRIFKLLHADCTEMSSELSTMYGDNSSTSGNNNQQGGRNARGSGGPAAFFGGGGQQNQPAQSERALEEAKMTAVADPRTNSVIVTCSHNTMEDIAMTIGRLDSSDTKRQYVRVYSLQNADPDNIANILHGIFTVNNQLQNTTQQTTDQLLQRTTTGASSDVVNTLSNTSGNGGGGGGRSNAP